MAFRLGALFHKVGGIAHQAGTGPEGDEADGEINEEDPAPGVLIGDPAAKGGAEDGGDERGDAEEGLRGALFFGWKGIEKNALAAGLKAAASEALEHAKKD